MEWLIYAAAGIISGMIGAMGMGGGGVLIIYLNLFTNVPQSRAQGINLLFFLPIALFAVIRYSQKRLIVWKTALPLAALGVVGTAVGCFLAGRFDNTILSKMFGVLLLIMGVTGLFSQKKKRISE